EGPARPAAQLHIMAIGTGLGQQERALDVKSHTVVAAVVVWSVALCASLSAQPILNRVEQFLRDQVGGAAPATAPPAAPATAPAAAAAVAPGYLGVVADDRQDLGHGVRIVSIAAGSPAQQAGLAPGDLITAINGAS